MGSIHTVFLLVLVIAAESLHSLAKSNQGIPIIITLITKRFPPSGNESKGNKF